MAPVPEAPENNNRKASPKLFSAKFLANIAPTAAFRKGRLSTVETSLTPEAEAHLCQLAALENFADHGMYVKFSDEEASALEDRAFAFALSESKADEEARKSGKPIPSSFSRSSSKTSQTMSKAEADSLLESLKTEDDPLFSRVAPSLAAGREPEAAEPPQEATSIVASGSMPPPPPKFTSFGAFKKKFLPKLGKSKKTRAQPLPPVPPNSNELPPGALGHGYSPGSYDHFAAEAAEHGMEYSNGYIFPKAVLLDETAAARISGIRDMEADRLSRVLAISAAQDQASSAAAAAEEDGAIVAVAMEVSKRQAEFDQILRDARMLRRDLEHEHCRCRDKQEDFEAQKAEIAAKSARLASKQKLPLHLSRQAAEADHNAREAETRKRALRDAVEELSQLESYIRRVEPPKDDAQALTDAIVRELLERLNIQGFDFHVPAASQDASGKGVLARYRESNPTSPAPSVQAGLGSSQAPSPQELSPLSSRAASLASELQLPSTGGSPAVQPLAVAFSAFQEQPREVPPLAFGAGSPMAPSTPVKPASAVPPSRGSHDSSEKASPGTRVNPPETLSEPTSHTPPSTESQRLQNLIVNRKAPPRSPGSWPVKKVPPPDSSSSPAMERKQSVCSSWDEKQCILPTGPIAVKRSPQVVHLYNEMRRTMPNVMERSYCQPEPLRLGTPSSASKLGAEESAKAPEVSGEGSSTQLGLVDRIALVLSRAQLKDMPAACQVRDIIQAELDGVENCQAVLAQTSGWPMGKWKALETATRFWVELQGLSDRLRSWTLGKGSFQSEIEAVEAFFDVSRVRVELIQTQAKDSSKKWQAAGIPWEPNSVRDCRVAALHIALLVMSRALFEVAKLERGQTLRAEECISDLADAIRIAHKVHQFVGGFHAEANELFERVKRLSQFYVRSRDPTWLRDSSKFSK